MNCHRNALTNPEEEHSLRDLNSCEIKGRSPGQGRMGAVTRYGNGDEDEESFVRFELPIVVTVWVVFLIIFGYFVYG